MIAQTFRTLYQPGDVAEVRAILRPGNRGFNPHLYTGWASGIVYGYFDNAEDCARCVQPLDDAGICSGIYCTLNPVMPDLLAIAKNRLRGWSKKEGIELVSDEKIMRRRWILVDVDPVRSVGNVDVSSTWAELKIAADVADSVTEYMSGIGWPTPIRALSGNGLHLLYRVDMPNDDKSYRFVKGLLSRLDLMFTDKEKVKVDPVMFNASRITKLYGTVARKGDEIPGRPWRRSQFSVK